jgi:hypothetical protein
VYRKRVTGALMIGSPSSSVYQVLYIRQKVCLKSPRADRKKVHMSVRLFAGFRSELLDLRVRSS